MNADIDQEFGIPVEEISCPGCGRTYKQARTVCSKCEECKRCCRCEAPKHVPARMFIRELLERI